MLYSFEVSSQRADTDGLAVKCATEEFEGTEALAVFVWEYGPPPRGTHFLQALATEAMGDGNAVDFAQQARGRVLEGAGAWVAQDHVVGLQPLTQTKRLELLTVEDHGCGGGRLPRGRRGRPLGGDGEALQCVGGRLRALASASPASRRTSRSVLGGPRRPPSFAPRWTAGGATVAPRPPPRIKRLALIKATLQLAATRVVVRHHLWELVGFWTFPVCFARSSLSLFATINQLVQEGSGKERDVLRLGVVGLQELLSTSCVGFLLEGSFRGTVLPFLLCSDARCSGGGWMVAPEPGAVANELWRGRASLVVTLATTTFTCG